MNTKKIMYDLVNVLNNKGFVLHYYRAITTDSCYMKLDFGMANSVRIADHRGKEKYKYRFNLMLNLDKSYVEDGRNYYCLNDFDKLVNDIVKFKNDQLDKYGFRYYEYMIENRKKLYNDDSSWKNARTNDNV